MIARIQCIFFILGMVVFVSCRPGQNRVRSRNIPVLYSTDLSHPHDDPDDHFDIVSLYALKELDILGIVLDQGKRQSHSPGRIPVEQMNVLTGRQVPCAVGLSDPLKSTDDEALDQDDDYQAGVDLMIRSLEKSKDPVTIITVGSLRDTAAAFNRRPDLFRKKVARLLSFIGEASADTREWNVGLDPHAFIRIMNSGLPVWWVPCFDGGNFKNRGKASFWTSDQAELLQDAPDGVMKFFIFALLNKTYSGHLEYLNQKIDPEERCLVLSGKRRLWCTAVFADVAGRAIIEREGEYIAMPDEEIRETDRRIEAFRFCPVSLFVDSDARVSYEESPRSHLIYRYEIINPDMYSRIMTSVTRHLIKNAIPAESAGKD